MARWKKAVFVGGGNAAVILGFLTWY